MSKIGKTPVVLKPGVTAAISADLVVVKGPKGELKVSLMPGIVVKQEGQELVVSRKNEVQQTRAGHGLIRSLLANAVDGVTDGYKKTLKLVGTGYRVSTKGAGLSVTVGFSHPVDIDAVAGIMLKAEGNDTIHIEGFDKQLVGQVAANIRAIRPPEVYQGKGIRYEEEVVKLKPGKAVTAATA
jgi:large subunit ribosomal protein L6